MKHLIQKTILSALVLMTVSTTAMAQPWGYKNWAWEQNEQGEWVETNPFRKKSKWVQASSGRWVRELDMNSQRLQDKWVLDGNNVWRLESELKARHNNGWVQTPSGEWVHQDDLPTNTQTWVQNSDGVWVIEK